MCIDVFAAKDARWRDAKVKQLGTLRGSMFGTALDALLRRPKMP